MAFIDYGQGGSGGGSIKPLPGSHGIHVSQWLSSTASDTMFNDMASFLSLQKDNIKHHWNRKAPFDTLYESIDDLAIDAYSWYLVRKPDWAKMLAALNAEYDPLENYNRTREGYDMYEDGTIHTETDGSTTDDATTTTKVAPYDSSTYSAQDEVILDDDTTNEQETTVTYDKYTRVNVNDHGNVGVTTSQQMIQSELELRKFNLLNYIITEFKREFCICLYN